MSQSSALRSMSPPTLLNSKPRRYRFTYFVGSARQDVIDMVRVAAGDAAGAVSEEACDGELAVAQFMGDRGVAVAQDMRGHAIQLRHFTNAHHGFSDVYERAVSAIRREHPR